MIVNNIDGSTSGGADQFFNVLTLLGDTNAYTARLKELNDAIAENKKYVELVAPAADILAMREAITAELAAKKEATQVAKTDAAAKIKAAEEQADKIIADARTKADALIVAAQQKLDDANAVKAAADSDAAAAAKLNAECDKREKTLAKALADAKQAKADAVQAQAEAVAAKADLAAKTKAFIESLA